MPRIEEVCREIPFGTVFTHAQNKLRYVYLGKTKNSEGFVHWFQSEKLSWSPSTYAMYQTAVHYFPELEKFKC